MDKEEIQFSIYKISKQQILDNLDNVDETNSTEKLLDKLLFYLECYINKSDGRDHVKKNEKNGYYIFFIKSRREPIWKSLILNLMEMTEENETIFKIFNDSSSYIIFKIVADEIYVMTGGHGSNYISKFIEKNFGLYLLPKLIQKNNPVLKRIVENNTSGNNLTTRRVTKNMSSLVAESNIGSIYKELSIQISNELAPKLGIPLEESKKLIGVSSGDSFVIRKSISIEILENVLNTLSELSKKEDNFILNYFVPAEKKRKKKSDLNNLLYDCIMNNNIESFEVIADDIETFYFSSDKFIIKNNDRIIMEKEEPIIFDDLISLMVEQCKRKMSINFIKNFLNSTYLLTLDDNGHTIIPQTKIITLIRGCLEIESDSYYLLNGEWYVFEDSYFAMLNQQYKDICDIILSKDDSIIKTFNLKKNEKCEDDYNETFKESDDVIFAHKKNFKNVEIADLIFWDDDSVYLMCNKSEFNGPGMRDLENQVFTSSSIISRARDNEPNILEQYYEKLNEEDKRIISRNEFKDMFRNKKIIYVLGFNENLKIDTRSVYCQYLLKEIYQNLQYNSMELMYINYKL